MGRRSRDFGGFAPLYRFADSLGTGLGTKDFIGNYSVTPIEGLIRPPADEVWNVHRMIVHIGDTPPVSSNNYGGLGSPLTNGILFVKRNASGTLVDLLDGLPIRENNHWSRYCFDLGLIDFGAGEDVVEARWTFTNAGQPLVLDGSAGEELALTFRDNFTGLNDHLFQFQGIILKIGVDVFR